MSNEQTPHLFGLEKSNRDFTIRESWGKNQFNSSFPAALCCYLHSKNIKANYLHIKQGSFDHGEISIENAFGIDPLGTDTYFSFESCHSPFQQFVIGTIPRTDLVIHNTRSGQCLSAFEVKLTALPDNTTCDSPESAFGSELVVRPDTIVYLACSITKGMGEQTKKYLQNIPEIGDWTDAQQVLPYVSQIIQALKNMSVALESYQTPFLLQPIWKTLGKSSQLADHCLDVFFWSDAGFLNFIAEIAINSHAAKITRQARTVIWLYKMLLDVVSDSKFNHGRIIDNLSHNTKNDKAFASSGNITNRFMACPRLLKPIIAKSEIQNIILGDGQNLLSPERRFDAIIYNSPELFQ
jgi:HindVP restriction endonuclease